MEVPQKFAWDVGGWWLRANLVIAFGSFYFIYYLGVLRGQIVDCTIVDSNVFQCKL
jgi:hypothetical protein